ERRTRPRWRTRVVQAQTLRWFRTMVVGRAPGFAPGPPVVGPWRAVMLERCRDIAVDEARVMPVLSGDTGVLPICMRVRTLGDLKIGRATLVARGEGDEHRSTIDVQERDGAHLMSGEVAISA